MAQFVSAIDIPRDRANSGCPRPHWAMVYRLRAPPSMAHTAKANIAGRGGRIPRGFLGPSTRLNASTNLEPNSPNFSSRTTNFPHSLNSPSIIHYPPSLFHIGVTQLRELWLGIG